MLSVRAGFVVSFALMLLTACGGGGSSSSTGTTTTTPPPTTTGSASVYVIQNPAMFGTGSGTILQFSANASGSATPSSSSVTGPANTSFNAVATDGAGNLYVAYTGPSNPGGIAVYSAGATGSAAPVRTLPANTTTGVTAVDGLATSSAGEIFVGEDYGGVQAFSAAATGSVAPSRRILGAFETGGGLSTIGTADAVAVDASDTLYVINQGSPGGQPILAFAPTATGNVAPLYSIGGALTGLSVGSLGGIATDGSGNLYVSVVSVGGVGPNLVYTGSILEFAAGSKGNVAPTRTITGALTTLHAVAGITVDPAGNIFVVSSTPALTTTSLNPTVLKFSASASGNVAPVSTFTSSAWTNPDNGGSIALH